LSTPTVSGTSAPLSGTGGNWVAGWRAKLRQILWFFAPDHDTKVQPRPLNIGTVSEKLGRFRGAGGRMQQQLYTLSQEGLRTDVAGMPLEWIDYRVAATLYHSGQVAYACGSPLYRIRGGYCAKSGARSIIEVNSIIATEGDTRTLERNRERYTPPLNNRTLFKRDANLCMYCGL